jgi:hypothetical protein
VLAEGEAEYEYGDTNSIPIPLPSEMMMNETAIAVSAPAMTALQDTPLHVAPHAPCEFTTATLSPTIVVSSMSLFSRQCSIRGLRRQFSDGACNANFAIQLPRSPCEPPNPVPVPGPAGHSLRASVQQSLRAAVQQNRLVELFPRAAFLIAKTIGKYRNEQRSADKEESHA